MISDNIPAKVGSYHYFIDLTDEEMKIVKDYPLNTAIYNNRGQYVDVDHILDVIHGILPQLFED